MDSDVASPYGLAPTIRDRDHAQVRFYEVSLFPHLCAILNRHHATEYSERYWRILLGHWFRRYVEVLLNRYQTLDCCLRAYRPSTLTAFSSEAYLLAQQDSYAAIWAFNDTHWNSGLYIQLLRYIDATGLTIEVLPPATQHITGAPTASQQVDLLRRGRAWALRQVRKAANHLSRSGDALIVNSFLPRLDEICLQLALKQFPQLHAGRTGIIPAVAIDSDLRSCLAAELNPELLIGLDRAVSELVFRLLPACYLEGYKLLTKAANDLPWPRKPRFIFTSNNFDTDELFKLWAAHKTETGVPYIAGQHGNNYGTSRYMNPSVEEITSDRFITWGWTDGLPQHVPCFIFKTGSKPKQTCNPKGGLLLIELHAAQMLKTWDAVAEYTEYFDEQLIFTGLLQSNVRKKLVVRLHHDFRNLGWDDVARWQEFDSTIQLETGITELQELIAGSRLVVHSYDSTGILENLAQNIPTIAFWQYGFAHLRDSAKPFYRRLLDVGIVHVSPKSAANHINSIWDDIGTWWSSTAVQEARIAFCARYARVSNSPVRELKQLLLDNAKTIKQGSK